MKYWKALAPILLPLLLYAAELLQRRAGLHLFAYRPVLQLLLLPGITLYYLWVRPAYLRYPLPLSVALLVFFLGQGLLSLGPHRGLGQATLVYAGFCYLSGAVLVLILYNLRFRYRPWFHPLHWGKWAGINTLLLATILDKLDLLPFALAGWHLFLLYFLIWLLHMLDELLLDDPETMRHYEALIEQIDRPPVQ